MDSVFRALSQLKAAGSFEDFLASVRTLLTFVANVLAHPGDPKYRRVRTSNAAFAQRVGGRPGGLEAMRAFGFESAVEDGQPVLVMAEAAAANPDLPAVKALLEDAMRQAAGAVAAHARAHARTQDAQRVLPHCFLHACALCSSLLTLRSHCLRRLQRPCRPPLRSRPRRSSAALAGWVAWVAWATLAAVPWEEGRVVWVECSTR